MLKNQPPTKGRLEYIRENFARNHGTQGTAMSRFQVEKTLQKRACNESLNRSRRRESALTFRKSATCMAE
jgi:hypothetical protein